jgi:hypothetical protein
MINAYTFPPASVSLDVTGIGAVSPGGEIVGTFTSIGLGEGVTWSIGAIDPNDTEISFGLGGGGLGENYNLIAYGGGVLQTYNGTITISGEAAATNGVIFGFTFPITVTS